MLKLKKKKKTYRSAAKAAARKPKVILMNTFISKNVHEFERLLKIPGQMKS